MNVRLPDGTVVQNIPDGTTKQELADKLSKNGYKVPPEWMAPKTTPGERARSFVQGLPATEKDPGMQAFEAGAVPEAGGPMAGIRAAGKVLPKAVTAPIAAGADWLDQVLGNAIGKAKNAIKPPSAETRAADVIQKTASDFPKARADIKAAAEGQTKPLVKGGRSTTAGTTSDEGMLGLEKTVRNMPGASERAGREIAAPNNLAREKVLNAMSSTPENVAKLKGARQAAADQLYAQADKARVPVDTQFKNLAERASMKQAIKRAKQLAIERGDPLGPDDLLKSANGKTVPGKAAGKILDQFGKPIQGATPASQNLTISGKGLHYMKIALDEGLERTPQNSISNTEHAGRAATQKQFMKWVEDRIPEYAKARDQFRAMSKPINRMELMQKIQAKATSNATDAAGNKIITRNGYQNAIKQYQKELARTMTPAQMKTIGAIAKDLDNAEKINSPMIKPAGSETMRHAQSAANVLGKLTGGHGAAAALSHLVSLAPGFGWLRGVAPEQVREILVDAMLDPKVANKLLGRATPQNMAQLSDSLKGIFAELNSEPELLAPLGVGAANASGQPQGQQQ